MPSRPAGLDSPQKFTLVVGDKEYSRRTALLVMGSIALFVVAFFGGIIALIVRGERKERRSDEEQSGLIALARTRGWSYSASKSGGADRYSGVEPFPTHSHGVGVSDYVEGRYRGRGFHCFEYRDEINDRRDRYQDQQRYFAVFALTTTASIPRVVVRQQKLLDDVFANGHVVRLGNSEFDKTFRIVANDVQIAREVVAGPLARFLITDSRAKDAPLRFDRGELITWYEGRLRPQEILPHLNYLCDVLEHVPQQV